MKNNTIKGHLLAFFCITIWGTTFIVSKNVMHTYTPVQLMFIRFIIAYAALWVLYPHWYFNLKDEIKFLIASLFANTLYFLAENTALTITHAANVSIIVTTAPVLTAVFQRILFKKKILFLQAIGYVVAFIGVVFVVLNGVLNLQLSPAGDFLALLATLCWAIYSLAIEKLNDTFNNLLLTRKLMLYGALTTFPIMLLSDGFPSFCMLFTKGIIAGVAYLGIVGSALCYIFWNYSIRNIGITSTNIYLYAIPLITLVSSSIFLNEEITAMGIIGIVIVIAGMVTASWHSLCKMTDF